MESLIDCAACGRSANPSHTEPAYCHECAERVNAEAMLAAEAEHMDSTDIAAITDYIEQMKAGAIAKGGRLDQNTNEPTTNAMPTKPATKKAAPIVSAKGVMPTTYKGKPVSRKQPTPKSEIVPMRPMGERNQGRKPMDPAKKQQLYTLRLPPDLRDKIIALGKDWLVTQIKHAKVP